LAVEVAAEAAALETVDRKETVEAVEAAEHMYPKF
jgi:hypothetical protein